MSFIANSVGFIASTIWIRNQDVFFNCPFDPQYSPISEAVIFTIFTCGFYARSALEATQEPQRLRRIVRIIRECRFAIHDLSRAGADPATGLARFNMPLELGIFIGAKEFGSKAQARKNFLIFDTERYRYQKFINDLNGYDPQAHGNDPKTAIKLTRNWLNSLRVARVALPGGAHICLLYETFRRELPVIAQQMKLEPDELGYIDFCAVVQTWLKLKVTPPR